MKKNLIIAGIFIILVGIYSFQELKAPKKGVSAGYFPIVPDTFSKEKVYEINFYKGDKKLEGITIKRDSANSGLWRLPTKFNAKASKTEIDNLLKDIEGVEGEERASDKSLFGEFGLEDDKGYHLALNSESGNELLHLIIGKKAQTYSYGFVRLNKNNDIYIADKDFRYKFGIYGEENITPDQDKWVNREIFSLTSDEIKIISLVKGNKEIVFEKSTIDLGSKGEKSKDDKKGKETIKWKIIKPENRAKDIPEDKIKSLLSSLSIFNSNSVVDPSKSEIYGLKTPSTLAVTLDDDSQQTALLGIGKNKEGAKKYYVKIKEEESIYEISDYVRNNTFGKIEDILAGK